MGDPDKPPWVVEAQAFIDREWAEYVHEVEHETRDCFCVRCDCDCADCRANGRGPFVRELISLASAAEERLNGYGAAPIPIMITPPTRMDDHAATE